jgi:Na+(H+)/acetate symporter ActP
MFAIAASAVVGAVLLYLFHRKKNNCAGSVFGTVLLCMSTLFLYFYLSDVKGIGISAILLALLK